MISLIFLVFLAPESSAYIGLYNDLNCTMFNGTSVVYAPEAVNCQNVVSDSYCRVAYPPTSPDIPYPEEGMDHERPLMCYTLDTATPAAIYRDAQATAVATCPRTCGLCCRTSAFMCKNLIYPRIDCNTITRAQCQSPVWRQILAEDCPARCGFCDLNGCIDAVPGCENDPSICHTIGMEQFVNQNCRRTCNRCSVSTQPPCAAGK
ncbi:unnamed protein product [Caenorhabditis nigoni]